MPSILDVMRAALQVSIHISLEKPGYNPLNYKDVFYLATLGGAEGKLIFDQSENNIVAFVIIPKCLLF